MSWDYLNSESEEVKRAFSQIDLLKDSTENCTVES